MAFNKKDVIGEFDAYAPIANESGVERVKAKAFINVGLNNQNFEAITSKLWQQGFKSAMQA